MSKEGRKRLLGLIIVVLVVSVFSIYSVYEAKTTPNLEKGVEQSQVMTVKLGIDHIDKAMPVFVNRRVGLITNSTGMNSNFESTVDVLYEKTNLVALFSPEHGIRGAVKAGDTVNGMIDEKTDLPIYSLYGKTKKPTAEMLADVDVVAFDIQDVGTRYYTYIYTMAYAMQSCKELGKTMVIFDRPNPIGGLQIEGGIVKPSFESFIGMYPIPIRHGMTVGELARLFNSEFGIGCDLVVVEMTGWKRDMHFNDTGLPWVMTSPNIPTPDTALVYPATGMFGGTAISEGVGTTRPFEFVGAPWLNADKLAQEMTSLTLPGVIFRPVYFTPRFALYSGEMCAGVQLYITDRKRFQPVKTGISLLYTIKSMSGTQFSFKRGDSPEGTINVIIGDDSVSTGRYSLPDLLNVWEKESQQFKEMSQKYYLYQ
ncbi:MAG: DUF1343 domain-containing protein [Sporomusaceae bacterium]|nr:DUF1343 domain-containing protein [Sporomusaceae bacterium]